MIRVYLLILFSSLINVANAGNYDFKGLIDSIESTPNPTEKIILINKGLVQAQLDGKNKVQAHFYLMKGYLYRFQGLDNLSMECLLQARDLFEVENNKIGKVISYLNLGSTIKDNKLRLFFLEEALEISKKENELDKIIRCYNNLFDYYYELNLTDTAIKFALKVFEIEKLNPGQDSLPGYILEGFGYAYLNWGNYLKDIGKFEEAIQYNKKSIGHFKTAKYMKGIVLATHNWAECLMGLKQTAQSLKLLNQSLVICEQYGFLKHESRTHELLAQCYQVLEDYYHSTKHLEKSILVSDSVKHLNELTITNILKSEFEYRQQLFQKNHEIELLEDKRKSEQERALILVCSSVIIILLILVFSYLVIRKQRSNSKKEKLILIQKNQIQEQEKKIVENELKFKRKEATSLSLFIDERNKFLKNILNQLKKITVSENLDRANEVSKGIKVTIEQKIHGSPGLVDIEHKIKGNTIDFRNKIETQFPQLTIGEKRLLSLLAINLSSKEISTILNISHESVNKKRYRLRSKLGIAKNESFEQYIMSRLFKK